MRERSGANWCAVAAIERKILSNGAFREGLKSDGEDDKTFRKSRFKNCVLFSNKGKVGIRKLKIKQTSFKT